MTEVPEKTPFPNGEGKKHDTGKPCWNLLPWHGQSQVIDVLTYGAEKYGVDNWKTVPNQKPRYISAAMRHFSAWIKGQKKDPETGLSHLAHAITCLLFLLEKELTENVTHEQ